MSLYKLKAAILVKFDLTRGNVFDLKSLLGIDEEDSFYHLLPARVGYSTITQEVPDLKIYNVKLHATMFMPEHQYTQHKLWTASSGEFIACDVDHARGHVITHSYLTELECYALAYGK